MTRTQMTCIECPRGCRLTVDIENCRVVRVEGNQCPKGEAYAVSEVEHPMRVLTSAVRAQGLEVPMVPVRTDAPIPKARIREGMQEVKMIRLDRPVEAGTVLDGDFLGLGVKLVATRRAGKLIT
jgi:CxxC motif-containing protein